MTRKYFQDLINVVQLVGVQGQAVILPRCAALTLETVSPFAGLLLGVLFFQAICHLRNTSHNLQAIQK